MYDLIIPIDFNDSYFFNNRPRWLLSLPNGKLMVEESIAPIVKNTSSIIIVCPAEHFNKSIKEINVVKSIKQNYCKNVKIIKTSKKLSKIESIVLAIKKGKISNSFFVKNPYTKFKFNYKKNNILICDQDKKLLASDFGFYSGKDFLKGFNTLNTNIKSVNKFLSVLEGDNYMFKTEFIDIDENWSTLKNYREFQRKHATLFLDVDGTLLKNGSKFADGAWNTEPLLNNMKAIANLQKTHNIHIIITTSRPSSEKTYLKEIFNKHNIKVGSYLFDLPHCQRILVNDFFESNPYPSASAINIERNQDNLMAYLEGILLN
jgi:hypothetical protein